MSLSFLCHFGLGMQQKCKQTILTSGKHQNMQTKITPNLGNAQTMQTKKNVKQMQQKNNENKNMQKNMQKQCKQNYSCAGAK
jgi:hypothetical protein